eukprot:6456677-Amphidinium_carterae.1
MALAKCDCLTVEVQRWSEKRYEEFLSDVMRQFEELSKQVAADITLAYCENPSRTGYWHIIPLSYGFRWGAFRFELEE